MVSNYQLLYFFSGAQPTIQWQNTIGGSHTDYLYSIQQTTDEGYILGGSSGSNISGDKTENCMGGSDYWVIKLDATGIIQWQNTIGGNETDALWSIKQTVDDGYVLGGWSRSDISGDKTENCLGDWDYWVVKLDLTGDIQWQNTIGGSYDDRLFSVQQTMDKGYILGGYSDSNISGDKTENNLGLHDYWVVKIDTNGTIQWQNTIGGNHWDYLYSVQQINDGGYILGGKSGSDISGDKTENCLGDWDYWVVKLDSIGNIQWQNTIGGSDWDELRAIQQTTDGGYILGGYSESNISADKTENCLGGQDYWVVKLDPAGSVQWQNTLGGSSGDFLRTIQQTTDGGYILGGYSYSDISGDKTENSLGISDYWVIKLDTTGSIQWQNTIGGNIYDELACIQQTTDGGYILGGYSESNISADKTENCLGFWDNWIVKLFPETIIGISTQLDLSYQKDIHIFPNPAHDFASIDFLSLKGSISQIYIKNILGECVACYYPGLNEKLQFSTSGMQNGMYIIEVIMDSNVIVKKLVIK